MLARMRHVAARPHVCLMDAAAASRDPTGTLDLRQRWRSEMEVRWRRMRAQFRATIIDQDMLGLSNKPTSLSIVMQSLPADGKIRAFQSWTDQTLGRVLLESDAAWLDPMTAVAYQRAVKRAQTVSRSTVVPPGQADAVAALQQFALVELQGVCEVVSQRVVRAASNAVLNGTSPRDLLAQCVKAVEDVGVQRSRALVEVMVVKAFATGTLDTFQAAGIGHVGVVPEKLPAQKVRAGDGLTRDAPRGTGPGSRISLETPPSPSTIARISKAEQAVSALETVEVLTAGDDLVCDECQGISDDGPYDIDTARSLIPAHPWCRCAFVPADDARFAGEGIL